MLNVCAVDMSSVNANMCQICSRPARISPASRNVITAMASWLHAMMRLRGMRSVTAPAIGETKRIGTLRIRFTAPSVVLAAGPDLEGAALSLQAAVRDRWLPRTAFTDSVPVEWNHWWPYEDAEVTEAVIATTGMPARTPMWRPS